LLNWLLAEQVEKIIDAYSDAPSHHFHFIRLYQFDADELDTLYMPKRLAIRAATFYPV